MKSKLIGILIAVVIIGGGYAAYSMTKDEDTASNNETTQSTSDNKDQADSDTPVFNPLASDNESFRATMEVTGTADSSDYSGVIERAKDGSLKFSGNQNGEAIEFYLLADQSYIACQNSTCFKINDGNAPIDVNDFTTTEEDIASYKDSANYKGKESCSSGTCHVWEYEESEGQFVTVYVDADSNRVVEVRGSDGEGDLKITYEYTDITITLPENVQELPGGI